MLTKVISGGQTGVDQAALRAARALGLPTGGWMPAGWRTLDGPRPQFREWYGMREHPRADYRARTWANVRDADGTLRLGLTFTSPGERCTRQAALHFGRPLFDIHLVRLTPLVWTTKERPEPVLEWAARHGISTLNVAGNSERTAPGIGAQAENILRYLFLKLLKGET